MTTPSPAPVTGEDRALQLAVFFHDTYERLAPSFGYETRKETRKFDPTTPNGKLMIAVCSASLASNAIREITSEDPTAFALSIARDIRRYFERPLIAKGGSEPLLIYIMPTLKASVAAKEAECAAAYLQLDDIRSGKVIVAPRNSQHAVSMMAAAQRFLDR